MSEPPSEDFVQSLARGLAVIAAFDGNHPEMTLSEVARRADVPAAAARRFLRTLEKLGYVRSDGRSFRLTPRVLELGYGYLSSLSLPEVMEPHLRELSAELAESVSAGVLDEDDVVYVARIPTRRIMSVSITLGSRFPAFATSMGRVLLAGLPEAELRERLRSAPRERFTPATLVDVDELVAEITRVRERGWSIVDGELEEGLRSMAVPVHGRDGAIVAALNVSTSVGRHAVETIESEFVPRARETAAAIEADLR
ncbi:IclR family transcriptional regulator [Cnuibacter physcomitrellae]|uniref:Glycerol operon regulatory protein n=1 Tax=Cnuibacter physcomitrellae TaxID=1619308 RepID=A0A1X9LNY2_9MICO|nr:IclR family transcriptional regulator C-terminal domain-containing protein [Cnuibacter physcomitrellae]ARJ06883.1 IclR family transcriptional regulator [Cnuibacter physcomitrellae]MCS5497732.1 helix-turn-helix domain-containing protein [Cnuibacter physcomitrellae]GGI39052.1 IclR family transcriptional regulator [Cnuibacter physcomitrellae]